MTAVRRWRWACSAPADSRRATPGAAPRGRPRCVPAHPVVRPFPVPQLVSSSSKLEAVTTDACCPPGAEAAVPCAPCCPPRTGRRARWSAAAGTWTLQTHAAPARPRARSPARTRPAGAPAPGRWSSPRACCAPGDARRDRRADRLQAAHPGRPRGVYALSRAPGAGLRGGRDPGRRRSTGAGCTWQPRGHAPGGGRARPRPGYVLTDGFPVRGLRPPGARRVEGRPGRRLRGGGVGAGQGHPGPDHGRAGRECPQYGFAEHKGYCTPEHDAALRGARAVPGAPVLVRQRPRRCGTA